MDYQYAATTEENRLVRGKVSAPSQEAAENMLSYGGYRVISVRPKRSLIDTSRVAAYFSSIKTTEVIMFFRQLALLLRSGTDVVTALGLLRDQMDNRSFRKVLNDVGQDIRNGTPLSEAMSKHPRAFPTLYHRLLAVGEQTGSLEDVLQRAAGYMEKRMVTQKTVKGAMIYPTMVLIVAVGVIGVMVGFVLPAFSGLYESLDAELPGTTRALLGLSAWTQDYGLYLLGAIGALLLAGFAYTRTSPGKYRWGLFMLRIPKIGRINLLNELARSCRSMALLYSSGLPLPEVMTFVVRGTSNKAMASALNSVHRGMIAGQGLSAPMRNNGLFLPLMVQMTAVGEETGNLDETLNTVAESYEAESDDKTKTLISMMTPTLTVIIGGVVGFIAVSLLSAMYSVYGTGGI